MICLDQFSFFESGPLISVGLLTANLEALDSELGRLRQAGVRLVHFDVSDDCFLPTLTFAAPVVAGIRTDMVKDVHLLVRDPLEMISPYIDAGADILTIHFESCTDTRPVFRRMNSVAAKNGRRILRGLALKPDTSVLAAEPLLEEIDYVLLLSIEPGQGRQSFRAETANRISALREMAGRRKRHLLVGVDGGITQSNAHEVAQMGPDILVTGSAIFNGGDPVHNYQTMAKTVRSGEVTHHDQPVVR